MTIAEIYRNHCDQHVTYHFYTFNEGVLVVITDPKDNNEPIAFYILTHDKWQEAIMREFLRNMEEVRQRHKGQKVCFERYHWYDFFYVVTVFEKKKNGKSGREIASYVIQSFTKLGKLGKQPTCCMMQRFKPHFGGAFNLKYMDKKIEFLKKYADLCKEYHLEIVGCGDCGSAWLGDVSDEDLQRGLCWRGDYTQIQFATKYDVEKDYITFLNTELKKL